MTRSLTNSRIGPELSLWMQAIGGSVREWRGRRELRHRSDDVFLAAEPHYYDPAAPTPVSAVASLSASPLAVMVPAPRITGYGRARRRTALAVAAIVAAAAIPAFAITSIFTASPDDDSVPTASTETVPGSHPAAQAVAAAQAGPARAVPDPAVPPAAPAAVPASKPHQVAATAAAPTAVHRATKPEQTTAAAGAKQRVDANELAQLPRNEKPISTTPVTQKPTRPVRVHHPRPAHSNSGENGHGSKAAPMTGQHPSAPAVGVGGTPAAQHPDTKPAETVPGGEHPVAPAAPTTPQAPAATAPAATKPASPETPGSTTKVDPPSRNATAPAGRTTTAEDPAAAPTEQGKTAGTPQTQPAAAPAAPAAPDKPPAAAQPAQNPPAKS